MKNAKWVRIFVLLLLFLTLHITSLNNSFVTKAQDQSVPPKLEGTQFEGMVMSVPPRFSKLNTYYIFEKQGRVICRRVVTSPAEYRTEYQFGNPKEVYYPGGINSSDELGTYKQTGNTVRLEFPDRYMEATIKAAGLEGVVTFKESNKREWWVVARPLGGVADSSKESAQPQAIPDSTGSTGMLVGACGFSIGKVIADRWLQEGGGAGVLGCAASGEINADKSPQGTTGRYVGFKGDSTHGPGAIYWHKIGRYSGQAFIVRGGILQLYKDMGGSSSWLGFPTSDEYDIPNGRRSDFEGGYIFWNKWTGYSQAFKYN